MSMAPPAYMTSVKHVKEIFAKIKSAGTPPKFTVEFLKSSLGFSSSSDRAIVPVLKHIKLLSDDGTPTDRYNQFRGPNGDTVLAQAIREAYADVFLANENANSMSDKELKDLFSSLTGKGDSVAQKMSTTFKTLCGLADFNGTAAAIDTDTDNGQETAASDDTTPEPLPKLQHGTTLTLRHDIHVHLPATSDVSVYKAIFRAINEELAD